MTTNYFDGRISKVGFFKPSDISTQASSIISTTYNRGVTAQYGKLTAAFKTDSGLSNWYDLNEYDGNAIDAHGSSDWTDNNTVTSAIGPGTDKIADESSNANHGTITGFTNTGDIVSTDVPSALAGSLDYSMAFDGVDDHVAFDANAIDSDLSLSVSFWVKTTATGNVGPFSVKTPGSSYYLSIALVAGKVTASPAFVVADTRESTVTVNNGVWRHVKVSKTADSIDSIYIDGVDRTAVAASRIGSANDNLSIGRASKFSDYFYMDGKVADVRVYDYILTADNVTYIYTNGASGTAPATGPVGQWGGSNDSFPVGAVVDGQPVIRATDRSGNSVDATSTTLSKRPIYVANVANGKGGLLFDATDDLMDLISTLSYTDFTCFAVVQLASDVTAATAGKLIVRGAQADSDVGGFMLGITTGNIASERLSVYAYDGVNSDGVAQNVSDIPSGTRLLTVRLNATTETVQQDGVEMTINEWGGGLDSSNPSKTWDKIESVGGTSGYAFSFDDHILAVLIYDSALSDDDMASVESYLSDQYGLGL